MNTKIDVYVNGIIASRLELSNTPKQNYGDIYIARMAVSSESYPH
jgi:hypothetical protein